MRVETFCITSPYDWLKSSRDFFSSNKHPISHQITISRALQQLRSLRILIGSLSDCVVCDWLEGLLSFWSYVTRLKTVLIRVFESSVLSTETSTERIVEE